MFNKEHIETLEKLFKIFVNPPLVKVEGEFLEIGNLSIGETEIEVNAITGKIKVPAFELSLAIYRSNYPFCPDGLDVCEIATDRNFGTIAVKAVKVYAEKLAEYELESFQLY